VFQVSCVLASCLFKTLWLISPHTYCVTYPLVKYACIRPITKLKTLYGGAGPKYYYTAFVAVHYLVRAASLISGRIFCPKRYDNNQVWHLGTLKWRSTHLSYRNVKFGMEISNVTKQADLAEWSKAMVLRFSEFLFLIRKVHGA